MSAAITVAGLSHAYKVTQALSDVSLTVEVGSVTAVLGPNGAGKSTLLKYLTGSNKARPGVVGIMGEDAGRASSLVRRLVGVVFQEPTLDRDLSAQENVALALMLHGRTWSRAAKEARSALANAGLSHLAARRARTLSGGEFRQVEIARAMAHRPSIVVMDEPTSGLDPVARELVWQQVAAARASFDTSFVFSTHYMDEVEHADQVYLMAQGRVESEGSPAQLKGMLDSGEITLRTADDERAVAEISALGMAVTRRDDELVVRSRSPEADFLTILDHLTPRIRRVHFHEPSLDDVFRTFDSEHRS